MVRAELKVRMAKLHDVPAVDRIAAMKDRLTATGDQAPELRHLPRWAAGEMADAGLYRLALPPELAGENPSPMDQIKVIEAVSAIDGSVGWCVRIDSEIDALVVRAFDPAVAPEVYDDWCIIHHTAGTTGGHMSSSLERKLRSARHREWP